MQMQYKKTSKIKKKIYIIRKNACLIKKNYPILLGNKRIHTSFTKPQYIRVPGEFRASS